MDVKVDITVTDLGKKVLRELEELGKKEVLIGYQAGVAVNKDGIDVAEVAELNELGTSRIPSRPFMRKSITDHDEEIGTFVHNVVGNVISGATDAQTALQQTGVFHKGLIQQTIVDGDFVPNAPYTIKRKKSDKPLIDTGQMRQSVNFVIQERK